MKEAEFASLVGSIYQSALEVDSWPVTLGAIRRSLGADGAVLGFSNMRGRSGLSANENLDLDTQQRWIEEFQGEDPWNQAAGNPPTGTVLHGEEFLSWDELRRMEVHRAVLSQANWDTMLCAVLRSDVKSSDYLTVARSHRRGPFEARQGEWLRHLTPHLVRAREIQERLNPIVSLASAWRELVERLPYGVLLLDAAGRVSFPNRAAAEMLTAGDGLGYRRGRLEAASLAATHEIHAALQRAAGTAGWPSGSVLLLPRGSGARPYQMLLAPLVGARARAVFGDAAVAVAVIGDPEAPWKAKANVLERLFELTPALSRLAAALASGRTLADYAREAGVSEGTGRQQLKELFRRTGTNRQAELVARLLTSVAALADGP